MAEKELSGRAKIVYRIIGLIGTLFFGTLIILGFVAGVYGVEQFWMLLLLLVVVPATFLFRRQINRALNRVMPAFLYRHPYLMLIIAILIGAVLGVLKALLR